MSKGPHEGIHGSIVVGRRGRYRLLGEIHRSEMSLIYVGERVADGLRVAVKFPLRKGDRLDELRAERLRVEIDVLKSLSHDGIVRYVDEGDGELFLVMDYVEGVPLSRVGRMEAGRALRVFKRIMEAVAFLHEMGYVHGDVKPGNVILRGDRPILIDFGTARRVGYERPTVYSSSFLTPDWAAPEEFKGGSAAPETDVYHLGELLFFMLTGENPRRYMRGWEPLDPRGLALKGEWPASLLRRWRPPLRTGTGVLVRRWPSYSTGLKETTWWSRTRGGTCTGGTA